MQYQVTKPNRGRTAEHIWEKMISSLAKTPQIKSIKGIIYNITRIDSSQIAYQANTRSNGEPESIKMEEFKAVIQKLVRLDKFNTNTSKPIFNEAGIYRKRSPTFALLIAAGVVEPC